MKHTGTDYEFGIDDINGNGEDLGIGTDLTNGMIGPDVAYTGTVEDLLVYLKENYPNAQTIELNASELDKTDVKYLEKYFSGDLFVNVEPKE